MWLLHVFNSLQWRHMSAKASQINGVSVVCSTVCSGADQSSPLAFVRGIHRWPMGSPHKWPVTRKMFPFDDVIMSRRWVNGWQGHIKLVAAYGKTSWWRHQMETFSALLALCAGNSSVTGEFPAQRPVTRSFDVLFGLRLNKRLSKQWWGWWFETLSSPLWRHCIGN